MLQPAIFALVCVTVGFTSKQVPPPIHPKSESDLHTVLPIEDSSYENPLAEAVGKSPRATAKSPRALVRQLSIESRGSVDIDVVSGSAVTTLH